jgi:drug/metabolite transporter (DMT)-like permease
MTTTDAAPRATPPSWLIWAALWVIYLVWGSTYLAIRVTVETLPPLLSAGLRFVVAGTIVYLFLLVRRGWRKVRVTRAQLIASTAVGTALLLGGNGLVTIGEIDVPSGLAALLIAAVPLWVVVLRLLTKEKVARGTMVAVAVGFAGVSILVLPGGGPAGAPIASMLLIVVASMSWAVGSFYSKRLPLHPDPFLSTAVQMLTGGALMFGAGLLRGEASGLDIASFSGASLSALAYLITIGSLLAFTAYVWLLQNAPISKVATYAYVNPVVAIFLGWLILSERITPTIIVGAAVIVAAVAAIVRMESVSAKRAAQQEAPQLSGVPATDAALAGRNLEAAVSRST